MIRGPLVMALASVAIIVVAVAFGASPRCEASSPRGERIAGVILLQGCP